MSTSVYAGGVLRQSWDDETRTFTEFDEQGAEVLSRPYTAEENAKADAGVIEEMVSTNHDALLAKAATALQRNIAALPQVDSVAGNGAFTNNTQRDAAIRGLAGHVAALLRQNNALIRLVSGLLSSQDGS